MARGENIAVGVRTLAVDLPTTDKGVIVDVSADVDAGLLGMLKARGITIFSSSPEYHTFRAAIRLEMMESVAAYPQVRFIQPKQESIASQSSDLTDTPDRASKNTRPSTSSSDQSPFSSDFDQRAERIRADWARLIQQQSISSPKDGDIHPLSNYADPILGVISLTPGVGLAGVGSADTQGDIAHRAYSARGTFNVDGTGVRIGVLSTGVTNLSASQASGDLPPNCSSATPPATEQCVNVLPGQADSGDEGTAMLEIIHDIAPGAQLYFATANPTITQFATNIRALRTAGCDIIVDDLGYFAESPFQDGQGPLVMSPNNAGVVTQAVNDVVADGALYFSAASNTGNKNDGTSGTWEGDFVDGGTISIISGTDHVNDFDSSAAVAQTNLLTAATNGFPVNLHWSDPLGGSSNDYDLYILNNAGTTVLSSSTNIQNGTQDPYEQAPPTVVANNRVVIVQKAGAANRFLHLDTNRSVLTFSTQGNTRGHSAASGAYGVAAVCASCSYPIATFSGTNTVETFSSDGPRRFFFNGDGTPITPGNFSSTGGAVIQQPVFAAADGVSESGAGGFTNPFFGTSPAATHAAAIAGLLKSANPTATQAQIKTALTSTAIDIEAMGTDPDSGFGIVSPYAALQAIGATGKAYLELSPAVKMEATGNANGLIESGEGGSLTFTLNNTGTVNASGITATLTTSTPGVFIPTDSSAYPNLAATSGSGTNTTPFQIMFDTASHGVPPDPIVNFTLTVNYTGGNTPAQIINFSIQFGRQPLTTTLDTTAPPTSVSYPTTSTTTQTNRVLRDGILSTCAANKTYPGASAGTALRTDTYSFVNNNGATACVTISLTPIKTSTVLHVVAYLGSYNPASISTNYLGDPGVSPSGLQTKSFNVNVPAGQTLIVVVHELTTGGGVGTQYTLQVSGLVSSVPITSASGASITGHVSVAANSASLANVTMTLSGTASGSTTTDAAGNYSFTNLAPGNYTVTPTKTNYSFTPTSQSVTVASIDQVANFTATSTATTASNNGSLLISEFRLQGRTPTSPPAGDANGELDEFIELYNNTASSMNISNYKIDAATGYTITIPAATTIPARGHYLIANSVGYSLSSYAAPDLTYTGFDLLNNTGLSLLNAANQVVDAVGFSGATPPYKEGTTLTQVGNPASGEYSLVRKVSNSNGLPQDSNDNAADFALVATDAGNYGSQVATLGAPGPENLNSPLTRGNTQATPSLIAPMVASSASPNRVRDNRAAVQTPNSLAGTLSIQRRFTNPAGSGVTLTRLRFRVIDITTLGSAGGGVGSGQADLRALSSTGAVTDSSGATVVTVLGTTLETPPAQANGGGLNSTLTVALPGGGLTPGASVDVQLLLGVNQAGSFRFFISQEVLP